MSQRGWLCAAKKRSPEREASDHGERYRARRVVPSLEDRGKEPVKNLNFLPAEVYQQRQVQFDQRFGMGLATTCGLVLITAVLWQTSVRLSLRAEEERLRPLSAAMRQLEQQYQQLQIEWQRQQHRANLLALLDAAWPCSTLLDAVWQACPSTVQVTRVHLYTVSRTTTTQAPSSLVQTTASGGSNQDPLQTEFKEIWDKRRQTQWRIDLEVATLDPASIHPFLERIQGSPLFTTARLESLSADTQHTPSRVTFNVRIDVRAAHTMPDLKKAVTVTESGPEESIALVGQDRHEFLATPTDLAGGIQENSP